MRIVYVLGFDGLSRVADVGKYSPPRTDGESKSYCILRHLYQSQTLELIYNFRQIPLANKPTFKALFLHRQNIRPLSFLTLSHGEQCSASDRNYRTRGKIEEAFLNIVWNMEQ
jgi:hypothetical protein